MAHRRRSRSSRRSRKVPAHRRRGNTGSRRARACISDNQAAMKTLRSIAAKLLDPSHHNHNLKEIWESGGCGSVTEFERAIRELDVILAKTRAEPPLLRKVKALFGATLEEVEHLREACDQAVGLMVGLSSANSAT